MPHAVRKQRTKLQPAAQSEPRMERSGPFRLSSRWVSLALVILALVYALLAGLHTVRDFDMGFHLATGRYVVEHRVIPSTDVLSYTAPGTEWLYPPFAGVLFYGIFSAWGYAGLSWLCALTLLATVACLLGGPSHQERGLAAAMAIMAVPELAARASPRPDLFTHLFFAIFLVQLWSFHRSDAAASGDEGTAARRLWTLPPLMLLWVNFHPGFIAGLGLLFAYVLIECLDLLSERRRSGVWHRLRLAWPALAATVAATLFNPYGPRIFKASLLISGFQGTSLPTSGVAEWQPVPLSFASLFQALNWRDDPYSSYWWLALAGLIVIIIALRQRQFGAALLVAAALFASLDHQRLKALFTIVVVVMGSSIFIDAFTNMDAFANKIPGTLKVTAQRWGLWNSLPAIAAGALCLVTCVRIADLISNRTYAVATSTMQFGPGESWWFPERAAAFIRREQLPANIFQTYALGGFAAWRLGPAYGDFIDGRFDHLAPAVLAEEQDLLSSPLDSPVWKTEADRRGINVLLFSLARVYGVGSGAQGTPDLMSLCQSQQWRPIYMDEVSIVLLRNRRENRPWIDRGQVDCQTHNFTPPPQASRLELSNFFANLGYILLRLGRQSEAREALDRAEALAPEDGSIHLALAGLYESHQEFEDAEREYKAALSFGRYDATTWRLLGRFYVLRGRYADARPSIVTAAQLSAMPDAAGDYVQLGVIDVDLREPQQALIDLSKAEELASAFYRGRENTNPELFAYIAAGRAAAYAQMGGELQRAIEFQQEAVRRTPESASLWKTLGDLYDGNGQKELAEQARRRASALSK